MQVFSTPSRNHGVPDSDLGHADEREVTLAQVLARPGARMRYTYDFGDDWEHDIALENILSPDTARGLPCLAGKGACPPEGEPVQNHQNAGTPRALDNTETH
jgi:hypothetical protein